MYGMYPPPSVPRYPTAMNGTVKVSRYIYIPWSKELSGGKAGTLSAISRFNVSHRREVESGIIVVTQTKKAGKPWKASNRKNQHLEVAKCGRFNFANVWHGSGRSFLENLTPFWSHIGGTMSAKLVALEKFHRHSTCLNLCFMLKTYQR